MLKTIFFDIGNVLCLFDPRKMVQEISRYSLIAPKKIENLLNQANVLKKYSLGQWTTKDLFNLIQNNCPQQLEWSAFNQALYDAFVPNTALWTWIETLKKGRMRLILISNTSEPQYNHWKKTYPIFDLFDDRVLSFELGIYKPDPRIFEIALSRAKASPNECLYIDDIPLFIESAKKVGLEGIVYTTQENLENELKQRIVSFKTIH